MAAPASSNISNLEGRWLMNHTLSDSIEPGLSLQGISFLLRKTITLASVTLEIKQFTAPPKAPNTSTDPVTHIDIQQIATAGLKGTREERCLDNTFRPHSDWIFGSVRGQSRWISLEEVEDEFLKKGWTIDDAEEAGPEGKKHVLSHVESVDNGWTATQIWGFQEVKGERRYVRNIVIKKGDKRVDMRLVYDYLGPLDA
ncbi:Uncharacterized protein SAPIO_CDS0776 [Scedosporium apiospermum]|uniref:Lccl domain-containing protein n=1 Tax=Pseudallescheria apiosperma TaxID=563466 RepID=A0A084GGI7_PSEDA|nr:Uncharacterized protein SAPIO_CDS0776 [Scedosporium apiospermum]KEZ46449.1 Uncharacterized protein SAPIO_CDS0776 [Scedosporium apiospermum]